MECLGNIKTKNYTISLLRCIAMIFIVLCHFFQYYEHELAWWFNVGVQIFFFISGFLYAHKTIQGTPVDFIERNAKKILIPYYCFLILAIFAYFLKNEPLDLSIIMNAFLCSGTINGIEHLWFISYILLCYIITPYLENLANKIKRYKWYIFCLYLIFGFVLGQTLSFAFNSYFQYNRIFCYLFGYFSGVFLQRYGIKLFRVLTGVLVVVTILANGLRVYCNYIVHISFPGFGAFSSYAHALLGATIVLIPLVYFKPLKQNAILDMSDKYSIYIYMVHQLFILSPFTFLTFTDYIVINWIITIIAIIISAIALKFLAERTESLLAKIAFLIKNKVYDYCKRKISQRSDFVSIQPHNDSRKCKRITLFCLDSLAKNASILLYYWRLDYESNPNPRR